MAQHDQSERNRYLRLVPFSIATCSVELAVGISAGSLALITDAIHTTLDVFENLLNAYVASRASLLRDARPIRKVGFVGSLVLIGLSTVYMAHEAVLRLLGQVTHTLSGWTVVIAVFSLLMNLWQLHIHFGAPQEHRNLTHWGQALHLTTDIAGSVAAITGTAAAVYFGIESADAWAALAIVGVIWWRMIYGARQAFGRHTDTHPIQGHHHH